MGLGFAEVGMWSPPWPPTRRHPAPLARPLQENLTPPKGRTQVGILHSLLPVLPPLCQHMSNPRSRTSLLPRFNVAFALLSFSLPGKGTFLDHVLRPDPQEHPSGLWNWASTHMQHLGYKCNPIALFSELITECVSRNGR